MKRHEITRSPVHLFTRSGHEMIEPVAEQPWIETALRVRYAETDAMGVAHHASYIVWLEQGRTELLRASGTSYRSIEAAGFFVVLTELQARYLAPARYDDVVAVRVRLDGLRSRGLSFAYDLRLAETGAPLLTARTEHIFVARATGRPTRAPAELLELLAHSTRKT